MRLIDTEEVIKAVDRHTFDTDDGLCLDEDITIILEEVPSAQTEIIRCKDCKYYGRADKRRFYRGMDCLNKHIDTIIPDKDFCSRAERRTDE